MIFIEREHGLRGRMSSDTLDEPAIYEIVSFL